LVPLGLQRAPHKYSSHLRATFHRAACSPFRHVTRHQPWTRHLVSFGLNWGEKAGQKQRDGTRERHPLFDVSKNGGGRQITIHLAKGVIIHASSVAIAGQKLYKTEHAEAQRISETATFTPSPLAKLQPSKHYGRRRQVGQERQNQSRQVHKPTHNRDRRHDDRDLQRLDPSRHRVWQRGHHTHQNHG
jgi:hypothetical protein